MKVSHYFIVVGFVLISVLGIIGNSFTIYVFRPRRRRLRLKQMNLLIFYLAIIDLISSVLNPILFLYWEFTQYTSWDFGNFMCILLPSFRKISIIISLGMISLITIERALIITHYRHLNITCRNVSLFVFIIILSSILTEFNYIMRLENSPKTFKVKVLCDDAETKISKTNLFTTSYSCDEIKTKKLNINNIMSSHKFKHLKDSNVEYGNQKPEDLLKGDFNAKCNMSCNPMQSTCDLRITKATAYINLCTVILRYSIALTIVIFSNMFIYKTLNSSDTFNILMGQNHSAREKGIFRLLVAMAIAFFCFVLPKEIYDVVYQFRSVGGDIINLKLSSEIDGFLALLQTANCVCNVFIYARLHKRFKATYSESLRRISLRFSIH